MGKTGFLFAGQGSQYVGMGQELYGNFDSARKVFDTAGEILDIDVKRLCFEGPEDLLARTDNTQPCMLTMASAITAVLEEHGISASHAAGLSLGEYSALTYAGFINLEDGLRLIRKRGSLMQNAIPEGKGSMCAVLGMDAAAITEYCHTFQGGILEVANFNCPGQIVITGEKDAVETAAVELKENGAMKTILLNVSGPFHSSMMQDASVTLENELQKISFQKTDILVLSNFDNEYYIDDKDNIIYKLRKQICSPVRWEDNVRRLIADGVDTFIEIGPGKTLASFMKKIDRGINVNSVEDSKSLDKLLSVFASSK